jgi:predicted Zn-dependent protease
VNRNVAVIVAARGIGRRECCWALVALGTLATVGCVSGSGQMSGGSMVSTERERAMGREAAVEVERTTGLVKDGRVTGYVRDVGARLIRGSAAQDGDWTFGVLDDDELNAFSLPGGYVYMSRGLVALLNTENELAGVLAHEVAHVVAHHGVRRATAAAPFALLFGVPAAALGFVSPDLGRLVAGAGKLAGGIVLSPYSREQEREADRLGMELAAGAGWDPAGLSAALHTLARAEQLLGHDPNRSSVFSTHPAIAERVIDTGRAAAGITRATGTSIAPTRPAFLARLDGLVVGPNPANGVFVDRRFLHPDLGFVLDVPGGWRSGNTPEAVVAADPDGRAVLLLRMIGEGRDPVVGARADGLREEVVRQLDRLQIGRLPAARVIADSGGARLHLTWIAHDNHVYRIAGVSRIGEFERFRQAFVQSAGTFRPMDDAERRRVTVVRLRSATARDGESLSALIRRVGGIWSAERTAISNAIEVNSRLEPGWLVKIQVRETYGGSRT